MGPSRTALPGTAALRLAATCGAAPPARPTLIAAVVTFRSVLPGLIRRRRERAGPTFEETGAFR